MTEKTARQMTMDELLALPATFGLEVAGRAWGYGRTKSHELARADEFPCKVMRKGKRYVVRKADLFTALGIPLEYLFGAAAGSNHARPAA
jgi:hypothetical protein